MNRVKPLILSIVVLTTLGFASAVTMAKDIETVSQAPSLTAEVSSSEQIDGEDVFRNHCQMCHTGILGSKAPSLQALANFPPSSIIHSLTVGVMRAMGNGLSGAERRSVAEFLSATPEIAKIMPSGQGMCNAAKPKHTKYNYGDAAWNGWGGNSLNTSYQRAEFAKLDKDDLSQLELKWAFGYPDSYSAWSQPVVVAGRLYVGSQSGQMFALDAESGCILWSFEAQAGVRGAVNVGQFTSDKGVIEAVYFGDQSRMVYGVNALTGERLWSLELEQHAKGRITGSPVLHADRLYVPMSSWRTVEDPGSSCCTFRGSMSAVDVNTGKLIWKTYTIEQEPGLTGEVDRRGNPLLGPSGGSIWQALTVDVKRNVIYAGTGNSYTGASPNANAVLAFDMQTGKITWSRQVLQNDIWVPGCKVADKTCKFNSGVNLDFSTAPILATTTEGKQLIVIGNKSGMVYALDPDDLGNIVWRHRAAEGSTAGGVVWGLGVDQEKVYVPISGIISPEPGGLQALDLNTGELIWTAPPVSPLLCGIERYGCNAAQPAGLAVTADMVLGGAVDGGFRAYSTETGKVLWVYDTNRNYQTTNGLEASGGSLIGVGPSIVNGMIYVNSGYGTNGGRPGNVLLAFGVK